MKVVVVLVLVAFVSVTLAKPPGKGIGTPCGKPGRRPGGRTGFGIRVPSIKKKDLIQFKTLLGMISMNVKDKLGGSIASANSGVDGADALGTLQAIAGDLQYIGDVVEKFMRRGRIMVVRAFVAGFAGEDLCKRLPEDFEKRVLTPKEKELRMMCLIHNVGGLIETFETVSAGLQLTDIGYTGLGQCDAMLKEEAVNGDIDNDVQMLGLLAADLKCLQGHVMTFFTLVSELTSEVEAKDPDLVRMGLVQALVVFETVVEDVKKSLSPFVNFMGRLEEGMNKPDIKPDINNPVRAMGGKKPGKTPDHSKEEKPDHSKEKPDHSKEKSDHSKEDKQDHSREDKPDHSKEDKPDQSKEDKLDYPKEDKPETPSGEKRDMMRTLEMISRLLETRADNN